jgi:multidrug efflux pump subunit AcrA (membrane-fusion protein)
MTDINRLITSLKRRSAHAKEFGHDVLFVKLDDLDALVEALEKAQQLETQAAEMAIQISKRLAEAYKRVTELEEAEQQLCAANVALDARAELAERQLAEIDSRTVNVKLTEPYAYLRENNGQIQISIGAERPSDRSGGYSTPWFAIYTAAVAEEVSNWNS